MRLFHIALLLLVCAFAHGETVYTPVFGASSVSCPANADTYISIPFARPSEFVGKVQNVSMDGDVLKLIAQGEPNWTANQFVYSKGVQPNYYYVKFTSGNLDGAWYNVTANGAYTLSLEFGAGELSQIAVGDTFEVIPHWSFSTLFPEGGNFTKKTGIAKVPSMIYKHTAFRDGKIVEVEEGTNKAYKSIYYYNAYSTIVGWVDKMNNNGKTLVGDDIIEPNCFLMVRQPAEACTSDLSGVLPMASTTVFVYNTSSTLAQDNYISLSNPVDITLSDLTAALVDSGVFSASKIVKTDFLYVYDNAKAVMNPAASKVYTFKSGSPGYWVEGSRNADADIIKAGSAIVIRKKATGAPVAARGKYSPFYIQ